MADMGGCQVLTPTPGTTVTVTVDPSVRHTIAAWTAAQATTINISGTPLDGAQLLILVTNDASLIRVLTFGTGLLGLGVVTGVVSKKSATTFVAYGGTFIEVGRSVGL